MYDVLAISSVGGSVTEMVRRLRTGTLQALFYHSCVIIQLSEGTRKDEYFSAVSIHHVIKSAKLDEDLAAM